MTDQESAGKPAETSQPTDAAKAPEGPKPAATTTPAAGQEQAEEFDKERALATIRKLREFEKTAKAQAKELDELRAAKQVQEDAKLSEVERLTKQVDGANQKAAEAETRRQAAEAEVLSEKRTRKVTVAASAAGAIDPSDANVVAATTSVDLSADNADQQITAAIEALKKAKPYLFKQAGATRLAGFNPGAGEGTVETDRQVFQRLMQASTHGKTPFG